MQKKLSAANIKQVSLGDGFWEQIDKTVREKVLPYQWQALNDQVADAEPSGCIANYELAAGRRKGEYHGCIFQDSDLGKWIEAVAYSLATHPDAELEKTVDDAIDLIGEAQRPDGYLNTYYTVKEPGRRWTNLRDGHELYCAGHMMEAAVAYYEATGKRKLLDIMHKAAVYITTVFGPEKGKLHGYPGHQEIELALVKLYHATGDARLLHLAAYFLKQRGGEEDYFGREHPEGSKYQPSYYQNHLPVTKQETMEGHCVRALYMLCGMADVAANTNDDELLHACQTLFDNIVNKRMYITGGIGSAFFGEAFTYDYDLPNDTCYAETCASVALVFFTHRMLQISPASIYADVMEQALYNTCLAGMSLDGTRFFYVNPLEVQPEASAQNPGKQHILADRPKWFGCACCPPNIARLVSSLGQYIYSSDSDSIYVHLFIDSKAEITVGGQVCSITQKTAYPYDGYLQLTVSAGEYAVRVRRPGWCTAYQLQINGDAVTPAEENGYLVIRRSWKAGDRISYQMEMPVRRVYCNPLVKDNIGKVCIARGPLVYCAEEADNGKRLNEWHIPTSSKFEVRFDKDLFGGTVVIQGEAKKCADIPQTLYTNQAPTFAKRSTLTLVPYFTWNNRGVGEMLIWFHEDKCNE